MARESIAAIDDGVGSIVQLLREYGIEDDTIIFYFGDNGVPLKIHMKDDPFDKPDWAMVGEKGMISDAGVTALALAGVKTTSDEIDGVNLMPYLAKGKKSDPQEALYWRFWGQSAIREGNWHSGVKHSGVTAQRGQVWTLDIGRAEGSAEENGAEKRK